MRIILKKTRQQITQHALDDEWAGGLTEEYCDRVLDFLLANFAERWLQGRGSKMDAVADFLSETVDDHFEVDVPREISLPIAKVLTTLHNECRTGVFTGVIHVLGKERVERILAKPKEEEEKRTKDAAAAETETKPAILAEPSDKDTTVESQQTGVDADISTLQVTKPAEEDDGWTTVSNKKKGKKKGKQFD